MLAYRLDDSPVWNTGASTMVVDTFDIIYVCLFGQTTSSRIEQKAPYLVAFGHNRSGIKAIAN